MIGCLLDGMLGRSCNVWKMYFTLYRHRDVYRIDWKLYSNYIQLPDRLAACASSQVEAVLQELFVSV